MPDDGRLDRILEQLPTDDALYLSALVEPPWRQRARRLAHRDAAIRAALALLAGAPNPAAQLAAMMAEQTGGRWDGTGDHLMVAAVGETLRLNGGAVMTERHLRNLAAEARTPRK